MIPMSQWLSNRKPIAPPAMADMADLDMGFSPPLAPILDMPDIDAIRAEAMAEGRAAAEAAFADKIEAALAEERAQSRQDLEAARAEWVRVEAEQLNAKLMAAFADLEAHLSRAAAAVLLPFLEDRARTAAIGEFKSALRAMHGKGVSIKLEAPADLLLALKADGGLPEAVDAVISEHPDMLATADATLVESSFGSWVSAMREAL